VYYDTQKLKVQISPTHTQHVDVKTAKTETYEPIQPGDTFSPRSAGEHGEFPWDSNRWFRIDVPPLSNEDERGRRYLHFSAHGEYIVYFNDTPYHGIDPCHPRCLLPDEECTLWLDGGQYQCGIWAGIPDPPDEHGFRLLKCDIEVRDLEAFDVYHDWNVLIDWIEQQYREEDIPLKTRAGYYKPLDTVDPKLRRMLKWMDDCVDVFDVNGVKGIKPMLTQIYESFPAEDCSLVANVVGHAHIDLVYLWPERVTYRKAIHTYSTVLKLMERYKELTFTMSNPPLYRHIEEHEPDQAKEIMEKIVFGSWEFTGGMEVEADTQIPVGEGLARCIIYGQDSFVKNNQGKKSRVIWIPDVFGYSQCLPQLFKLAGINYFFTTKILWSAITKFPHNSFVWLSPDGSEVVAHLSVSGYACEINIQELIEAKRNYKQSDVHNEFLMPSGYGDGGGGPTEEHCERARRLKSLSGVPKVQWTTAESFFDRLNLVQDQLPRYRGELFLEYHRGVHTTQSNFKALLRACERSLQLREACRVINGQEALKSDAWLRYLFALFHDATPGTSINTVYSELNPELESIANEHLAAIHKEWPSTSSWTGASSLLVVNPLLWSRRKIVELPQHCSFPSIESDEKYYTQIVGEQVLASIPMNPLEAMKCDPTSESIEAVCENTITSTPTSLDNGIVRAKFDAMGSLESLQIHGNTILMETPGSFIMHDDNPATYDAWDLDHHTVWMKQNAIIDSLNLKVIADGPCIGIIEGQAALSDKSSITVRFILEAHSDSLKVECDVDWNETNKALCYEVQTGYRGEIGRFGAPFGSVDRCQTMQREREEAQWEVPGSRWASVLDGRLRGLSIITEAKY